MLTQHFFLFFLLLEGRTRDRNTAMLFSGRHKQIGIVVELPRTSRVMKLLHSSGPIACFQSFDTVLEDFNNHSSLKFATTLKL